VTVLPGVHSIELPLPWELETVNAYLVRQADGYLLVDCGIGTESCFEALRAGMESAGVAWGDVKTMVITHVHPDHVGLAARVQELSGAEVWMHCDEVEHFNIYADPERSAPWRRNSLTLGGVPEDVQRKMGTVFHEMRDNFRKLHLTRMVSGGEKIPTSLGELEVVWTPGHSPGHICLYQRERRLLFSGDQILEHITPNISWQEDCDTLGNYLDSLRLLSEMEIELVLPSHGKAFSGHREWVSATSKHHEERCERILGALADGPKTADEITGQLWRRRLSSLHRYFAVLEIMAHLEYMARRGRVGREVRGGAFVFSLPCELPSPLTVDRMQ
jgi:glyoxylase-like metal-dependent hydrolase (beta-lactamase superfamily II)